MHAPKTVSHKIREKHIETAHGRITATKTCDNRQRMKMTTIKERNRRHRTSQMHNVRLLALYNANNNNQTELLDSNCLY